MRWKAFTGTDNGPRPHVPFNGMEGLPLEQQTVPDQAAKTAFDNLRTYSNCCRATLWALQTHLDLPGEGAWRATATLSGGLGRGETCGALIGALMGLGLALGPASVDDLAADERARQAKLDLVERFATMFTSTRCYEVQEYLVGWRRDDPSKADAWERDNGPVACALLCAEAARASAQIILLARNGTPS